MVIEYSLPLPSVALTVRERSSKKEESAYKVLLL
jgi:hypothetical protein